jgi:hypothetical protein
MLRHILVNRMKTVASNPTKFTMSCSLVCHNGYSHAQGLFPSGGGWCFWSATRSLGAYTTVLYGRRKEKHMAMPTVMPTEEAKAAHIDDA